jgi:uncharacterized membrane protein
MDDDRSRAAAEFRRMIKWIVLVGVLMCVAALAYLGATGDLDANMVIATVLGVFFSVLLGCGLFAAAFFSDKSGHDDRISRTHKDGTDAEQ